uniref:Uncharacterized protein n=1 Tax=Tanacetum cinerariifolium TaxID=118510 RepID=A0A6L2N0W3_TANCI|nr:hypothetical protein [Tanacetum cinerariifolium]
MENVILPDHMDDLPVVEPNQPDVVHVIHEPVLVDEEEDPGEEEFKEEEEDMDIDDEEDENEPEFKFPYEEVDPFSPLPPAFDSEPEDVIEVEDTVEPEDETVPATVHEIAESSIVTFLREDVMDYYGPCIGQKKGKEICKYYGKLIADLGNEVRSSVEKGVAAMENLVRKLGNAEEGAECKKLKKEPEEARFSNTLLRMQNERVKRDLYWTRVQAYEFYQEMIRKGVVFEERPNEDIDDPVEYEDSLLIRTFATSCPNEAKARTIELKPGICSEDEKGKEY